MARHLWEAYNDPSEMARTPEGVLEESWRNDKESHVNPNKNLEKLYINQRES